MKTTHHLPMITQIPHNPSSNFFTSPFFSCWKFIKGGKKKLKEKNRTE
jgi:hypothetical protein